MDAESAKELRPIPAKAKIEIMPAYTIERSCPRGNGRVQKSGRDTRDIALNAFGSNASGPVHLLAIPMAKCFTLDHRYGNMNIKKIVNYSFVRKKKGIAQHRFVKPETRQEKANDW